ncbi:MAG: DNA-processing protein DprA [Clostridia bacterium]|nr:DNA-processing protein DprA [Clostridia bacterium]
MDGKFTRETLCRAWLQNAEGLSWRAQETLLAYFGSGEVIFDLLGGTMLAIAGEKAYKSLVNSKNEGLERIEQRLLENDAQLVVRGTSGYPYLLEQINDPPHALFIKGLPADDEKSVAIVGSRRETRYGRTQAYNIAKELAQHGVTIVSGLARGIDTAAHEGALAGGGRTVAVLGNGIDQIYPPENTELARRIVDQGGAIISEFPFGSAPLAHHFPIRNRIISGISAATLLVEGHARSGTMITAGYAAEQGREVFALPGMVDAPGSAAPLRLLREGANICTCAQDILLDMRWEGERKSEEKVQVSSSFTPEQQVIVSALANEQKYFEELITLTGLSPEVLTGELAMLELDGVVESRAGRAYALLTK